jgi:hypothetical protein
VLTQNLYTDPADAWFEMFDVYRNRTALKRHAGVALTGQDNKAPVLHYTLSWHASDQPDPEHMKAMALETLKVLGLAEHQSVIACHNDKEHHHVHVVVNTVHPYTGKTAPLKRSKLELSKWAEAYEKEHGIHCENRIENNKKRRDLAKLRENERVAAEFARAAGKDPAEPAPFEPVNDNSPNRRRWFERKEIIDRMKALRAALDQEHKAERGASWTKQVAERDQVERDTRKALDTVRSAVRDEFKGRWRDLYKEQKRESRQLSNIATHPLERAVYVFRNRERLGDGGKPLTLRRMIPLILSGKKLNKKVLQVHDRERRALAREEKTVAKVHSERVWQSHRETFHQVRHRQAQEREAARAHQHGERKDITFARAKAELTREADQLAAKPVVRAQPERQAEPPKPEPARAPMKADRTTSLNLPIAPKRPTRRLFDPDNILLPGQPDAAKDVPVAPVPQPAQDRAEQAKAQLMRGDSVPGGIPAVSPAPRTPEPKQHLASKPFREAVRPGTPDVAKAFRDAAAPEPPKKPTKDSPDRIRRMKEEFDKYRKRGRGDFERER